MEFPGKYWVKNKRRVDALYSDGSLEIDLPTGVWLFRTVIKPVGNIIIRDIFIRNPKAYRRIQVLTGDTPDYEPLQPPGITVIPYMAGSVQGWDLRKFRSGDYKFGFTIDIARYEMDKPLEFGEIILHHELSPQGPEAKDEY